MDFDSFFFASQLLLCMCEKEREKEHPRSTHHSFTKNHVRNTGISMPMQLIACFRIHHCGE